MEISGPGGGSNHTHLTERGEILEDAHDKKDELRAEDLELKLNEPFLNFMRLRLIPQWGQGFTSECQLKTAQDQLEWHSQIKPTRLPVLALHIGNKKFARTNECDIFVKFFYHKKSVIFQMSKDKLCRKVDIPFDDITSFCFVFGQQSDILTIEVKSSLIPLSAAKPLPGKFLDWKVDYSKDDEYYFPESKSLWVEAEKGSLEKTYAKLKYTNPHLTCLFTDAGEQGGSDWLNRIMFNEHFADDLWHMGLHDDAF
ncbi:hypothetical protein OsI_23041 [Oryza sativa Indica Group]|uniref:TRF2/HOY1 PH-like domain-containing protein n=3 Tax=Oryza TaxID=4527 RepID=A0A0E0HR79_ORYNI|nr:uncharacterized protein LOC127775434 isoform X1 [Oryza glaberrima]XP_052157638.1 uncharacterized protein LOC127775434 isoform X1 [Oryza glaberrima]XP_052157639.1 uncharacterized protein LOC127775434 isoform X1 [Oryza glaberrima]EEC80649.1 hypothetical protein OsI_23041 [Oryza sativa Indica Group]